MLKVALRTRLILLASTNITGPTLTNASPCLRLALAAWCHFYGVSFDALNLKCSGQYQHYGILVMIPPKKMEGNEIIIRHNFNDSP